MPEPHATQAAPPKQTAGAPEGSRGETIVVVPQPGEDSAAAIQRMLSNRPKSGDYTPIFDAKGRLVFVTELPEAVERVAPNYPLAAREKGVSGTVMVQALVIEDGTVADIRIMKSIPELDAAAAECVRKWRFKPALNGATPVSVWVGVPIRFSLH
jgi:TonB family protein